MTGCALFPACPRLREISHGSFELKPAGVCRRELFLGRAPLPDAPALPLCASVCCCATLYWPWIAHGGLQRSSADCEVPSLQRAAGVVWRFHLFAARVECSHPDTPTNVGENVESFCGRVNVFVWDCGDAPALAQTTELCVRGKYQILRGTVDRFFKLTQCQSIFFHVLVWLLSSQTSSLG